MALALVIAMAGLALILERIWLDAAQLELTTAAEAVALAAARELASDDLLCEDADSRDRLSAAREIAAQLAQANRVAGQIPSFDGEDADLEFGNYDADAGFQLDDDNPHTVRATLSRSRVRNNPVALFVGELTGVPFGDVVRRADATIDHRICAVSAVGTSPVPALPMAIWKSDPSGNRSDTWKVQIDEGRGTDKYAIDDDTGCPVRGKDGIREITVKSVARNGRPEACNLQLLDIGTQFDDEKLYRQLLTGWSADDLESFGGQLSPDLTLKSSASLLQAERGALEQILGQPRICLLFTQAVPASESPFTETTIAEFVAIRVMAVKDESDGSCSLVLQPTVMTVRHARRSADAGPNKYVFNLQLTN